MKFGFFLTWCLAVQKKRIAEGTNDINVAGYDKRDLQKVLNQAQKDANGEYDDGAMEEE